MNRVYKSIFNARTGTFVAVSEATSSGGKASKSNICALAPVALAIGLTLATPYAAAVTVGSNNAGNAFAAQPAGSAGSSLGIAVGPGAGVSVSGDRNTAIGQDAGNTVTGDRNIAIGRFAGSTVSGNFNNAIGHDAGRSVTGDNNNAFGEVAGRSVTGNQNNAFGTNAGQTVSGNQNNAKWCLGRSIRHR